MITMCVPTVGTRLIFTIADEVYKEAVEKWLDDQAEVERLRESDPKKYEKTYF